MEIIRFLPWNWGRGLPLHSQVTYSALDLFNADLIKCNLLPRPQTIVIEDAVHTWVQFIVVSLLISNGEGEEVNYNGSIISLGFT